MSTFRRLGQRSVKPTRKPGEELTPEAKEERLTRLRASKKATADLTNAVLNRLNLSGFVAWRNNNIPSQVTKITEINGEKKISSRYKSNNVFIGTFDIIGFRKFDGKHLELEIKTGKDKLSKEQARHLDRLVRSKCISFVVRNLDEFEILIKPYL